MVLGAVVAEKPGVIGRLQQLQALFVETVDWTGAAVDPIEHAKADLVHRRPPVAYRAILGRPGGERNEIQVKQSLRIAKRTPAFLFDLIDPSPRQGPVRGQKYGFGCPRLDGSIAPEPAVRLPMD